MKKLIAILMLTLVACGGAAGTTILDEQPAASPDAALVAPDSGAEPIPTPKAKVAPDAGGEADSSLPIVSDAAPDALADAAPDADADAGVIIDPPPPPPACIIRGSCQVTPATCMEYEDNGNELAKAKAKCTGAQVWSNAPCVRANVVGLCNLEIAGEILCPKYAVLYTTPATPVTAQNACLSLGGTFVP